MNGRKTDNGSVAARARRGRDRAYIQSTCCPHVSHMYICRLRPLDGSRRASTVARLQDAARLVSVHSKTPEQSLIYMPTTHLAPPLLPFAPRGFRATRKLLWPRGRDQAARQLQAADCDIESDLAEGRAECERRLHASRPGGPGRGTLDGWALQCTTHHSHHGPSITPSLKSGDGGEMVGRFVQVHGCRLSERLSVGGPADPAPIRVHWRHAVHPTSARVRPGSADLKRH